MSYCSQGLKASVIKLVTFALNPLLVARKSKSVILLQLGEEGDDVRDAETGEFPRI